MSPIRPRQVLGRSSPARLACDEPVTARDADTGIDLHYRFEHAVGGRLRLSGGVLGNRLLSVGYDPDDLDLVATVLLDGLKVRLR